jgi:flagellar protein FliO/FliZ
MSEAPDLLMSSLRMFGMLVFLLAGLLIVHRFVRRGANGEIRGYGCSLIRILGNTPLGGKRSISLVEVPGGVLVLGLSSDGVRLLSRIDDPDSLQMIRQWEQARATASLSDPFRKLASKLMPARRGGGES